VKGALNLMKDAAWLTPDDALKYGLIDEISNEKNMQIVDNAISKKIMNALKMPAIPIKQPAEQEPEKKNMVTAIKDALTQIFGGSVANVSPAEAPKVQSEKDNTIMKKDYVKVNTLLNVEGIEVKDGNITMTEDQVKSINDALAEKDAKVDELNKSLNTAKADQQTAADALSNAEKTIDTISDDIKSTEGLAGKVDKIKTIMNHVAGVPVDTPAAEHDPDDCSDVAKDPVNDMVAPYLHRNTKK
jgi:chromosome segregation ATPase